MKKILKVLIIITSVFGLVYLYQLNKYMTLNDTDRDLILNSFGKDSDGKGFSDEGHRVMMEDLAQLKGQIPDEKLKELEFFYKKTMILEEFQYYLKIKKSMLRMKL